MPRLLTALFLVLLFPLAGFAAESATAPAPRITLDVAYLAPGRKEKLDLYLPAPPLAGRLSPAVVWIHGGGWMAGTKSETRAQEVCTTLAKAGYVAVSIEYRLGEGAWPTNLQDCKNGVRFLRAHAKEYQIEPARIAVAGGSAGGHLALMVGFTGDQPAFDPKPADALYHGVSCAVSAVIDMYGISDLRTRRAIADDGSLTAKILAPGPAAVFGPADVPGDIYRLASPVTHIAKNSPPVLILHGLIDKTVDRAQAEDLERALTAAGVPHELVMVLGAGHTFDFETWNKKPLTRDLRPVALAFLGKYLGP
jgi:acetyl esterase/lipase